MKTILRIGIVVVLLCLIAKPVQAQDKTTLIDELMTQYFDYGQFNGAVLVAEKGDVLFKKGYGFANMNWEIPNEPDTKFRIGSITKQFVAMLVMQLVEQGKIKLDGKLTDYLPEYRKDTGDKITIHHLLTHTSGIPSYTGLPHFWSDSTVVNYNIDYMIENFHSGDLEFEPGTKFNYNNTGYYLLAVIIEKVTGKSFRENLQENILKPLKMVNSDAERNNEIIKNKADGFLRAGKKYKNEPYFHMTNALGAGDMYSTVEDMYLWDQALYTEKLLSKKYKEKMFTPFLDNYAYGWGIYKAPLGESTDSVNVISHSGGINGFNTRIWRLIDDKHLVVVLNNTGSTDTRGICMAITNILYDKPYELPKLSIAETIREIISENDVNTAIEKYYELKANNEKKYNFSESELNRLGYQLLEMDKVKDAIEIFKLNIEIFPEAFNPYDSLGEAYMIDGQTDLAIKFYAKSLELNPENYGAIRMLNKIISDN